MTLKRRFLDIIFGTTVSRSNSKYKLPVRDLQLRE